MIKLFILALTNSKILLNTLSSHIRIGQSGATILFSALFNRFRRYSNFDRDIYINNFLTYHFILIRRITNEIVSFNFSLYLHRVNKLLTIKRLWPLIRRLLFLNTNQIRLPQLLDLVTLEFYTARLVLAQQ